MMLGDNNVWVGNNGELRRYGIDDGELVYKTGASEWFIIIHVEEICMFLCQIRAHRVNGCKLSSLLDEVC
jgi:hypothetical protein